jgi:hypothetical protein
MVINTSKVKTEALLLFCRDLIESYNQSDSSSFDIDNQIKQFIDERCKQLLESINILVQPIPYYLRNVQVSRINLIIKTYEFIHSSISKILKEGEAFNPSMLCFSLLSTWFAELEMCKDDKEFLYFSIYPYSEIYDKLLLNLKNQEYKQLNISMLNIAETTILKLNNYRFR